jgi:L-fuconate dehydratase
MTDPLRVPDLTIRAVDVADVRVPTSDSLLGSDPFHRKPDYSAAVIRVATDAGIEGWSLVFNIGAGNDWAVHGVRDLAVLLEGCRLDDMVRDPAFLHQTLVEHHQLRWLGDGLFRMACGGLVNALWDLWAKALGKPLWRLLVDLAPETIVASVDWRYLRDALSPEEALGILRRGRDGLEERVQALEAHGPAAYSTSGWLGLGDEEIRAGIDVDEAIEWMRELAPFRPYWIEEPTARDDVLGFVRIREALRPLGIGVAAGEAVLSPVMFKQMLASGALSHCQIDATRLGGVNDVVAVVLMAAKFGVPVCPHGGGIGLCNMIRHYAVWDQAAVSGERDGRLVEYLDFLQADVFEHPVAVADGRYRTPSSPGWGLEMKPDFLASHRYPDGPVWSGRPGPKGPAFLA